MKSVILVVVVHFFAQLGFADQIFRDKNGFVTCVEKNDQIYFFDWDRIIRTQEKNVSYFTVDDYVKASGHSIKSCRDQKYIRDIPFEILKPTSYLKHIFTQEVLFSSQQIAEGGRVFRSEKNAVQFIKQRPYLFQQDSPTQIENIRENYGDQFASSVIKEWSSSLFPHAQSCEKYIGTCDFYLCQEQKSSCGLDGYNLGFGFKYCSGSKFQLLDQMQTALGKSWVVAVFKCLQKQSYLDSLHMQNRTCEGIKSDAFHSHPDCYVQSGFCELKIAEKIKIFKLIKKEFFSSATIQQGLDLLNKCQLKTEDIHQLQKELYTNGGS